MSIFDAPLKSFIPTHRLTDWQTDRLTDWQTDWHPYSINIYRTRADARRLIHDGVGYKIILTSYVLCIGDGYMAGCFPFGRITAFGLHLIGPTPQYSVGSQPATENRFNCLEKPFEPNAYLLWGILSHFYHNFLERHTISAFSCLFGEVKIAKNRNFRDTT